MIFPLLTGLNGFYLNFVMLNDWHSNAGSSAYLPLKTAVAFLALMAGILLLIQFSGKKYPILNGVGVWFLAMSGIDILCVVGAINLLDSSPAFLPATSSLIWISGIVEFVSLGAFFTMLLTNIENLRKHITFATTLAAVLGISLPLSAIFFWMGFMQFVEAVLSIDFSMLVLALFLQIKKSLNRAKQSQENLTWASEEVQHEMEERRWAEEQLQESRLFLESIVETIREPLVVLDSELKVLKVNRSFCEFFNVQSEDILLNYFHEICAAQWRQPELLEALQTTISTGNHFENFEITKAFAGIGLRTMLLSASPIHQNSSDINLVLLTMTDITAQKKAQDESRRLIRGIESAAESILLTDVTEQIKYVNPALKKLTNKNVIGQQLMYFLQNMGWSKSDYQRMLQAIAEGQVWSGEICNSQSGRKRKNYLITVAPVLNEDQKIDGLVAVLNDITKLKMAEERLAQHAEELARSNSELEQFAYIASHDLQEPLRMVSSYCQLLKKRYYGKLEGDACEFIDFAVDGAQRMQTLIEDLLTYSRVGTRGQPFETTDCNEVMATVTNNLQIAIEESAADIKCSKLPVTIADRTQLVQLFQNLIGNAIKFRNGEVPKIRIRSKKENGRWVFSIKDNGIGIDAEFKQRIFEIFQRLHSKDKYPGTGIGLAICKKIVERHNGEIWLESQSDKGSTFYFTLPLNGVSNQ